MNICNYKPIHWQPNIVPDVNSRFRFVYRSICHIQASSFEFLYGSNDPLNDPNHSHAIYLNTTDGTIWDWNNTTSTWELIYTPTGGPGGSQNLQQVLDEGNTAINQTITLFADGSRYSAISDDDVAEAIIGVDTEPYLLFRNSSNNELYLRMSLASGNTVEYPANSGTLALLSDIPPATPTVIVTKTTTYTLQLADADNDTLFEMNAATDEDFIIDSAINFPIGTSFIFARRGIGELNIIPNGSTVILSANAATNLTFQDSGATIIKVSATEWRLFGDIGDPVVTTPGGLNKEIQFNDNNTGFGGASGFTYGPLNVSGVLELDSTETVRAVFSINSSAASSTIFQIVDRANPGTSKYFTVGPAGGLMAGSWVVSNGGNLTIATAALGASSMFRLSNVATTRRIDFLLNSDNTFSIKDNTAGADRFIINPAGEILIPTLDTDGTAPTTTGTTKNVMADGAGKLTFSTIKEYVAILDQTGTSAPTATVLRNTLGGTVVWSYVSDGAYEATLTGAFPTLKTVFSIVNYSSDYQVAAYADGSNNKIILNVVSVSGGYLPSNDGLTQCSFQIFVYP